MSLENYPSFVLDFSECEVNGTERHFYHFKSFRLDVGERQLLHNFVPVDLTPKAFDVLAVLVENGGRLIEKDELLQQVWPDSFVEEANIPRIIHTLRRTLGHDDNGNKLIETVPTKGYRFVAEVTEEIVPVPELGGNGASPHGIANAEIDEISKVQSAAEPKRQRSLMRFAFVAVAMLITAAVGVYLFSLRNARTTASAENRVTIAVLPFNPIGQENRDEANDLGFALLLINQLNKSKNIKVRPFSSIKGFTEPNQDAVSIGKKIRADYVLESNYLVNGGRLLITSELHNVASGEVDETFSYETTSANRFASGDAIVSNITRDLLAQLNVEQLNMPAKRGTDNEEAFRRYMHGIMLTDKRTRDDAEKAIADFENAVKLDPNFALAYAGLAFAHTTVKVNGGDVSFHCGKALETAQQALSLDSTLAEAYSILGMNQSTCQWNQTAAEESHRKAIELAPNSAFVHRLYGVFLTHLGRGEESINEMRTAFDLDPTSLFTQKLIGRALFYARRYKDAIEQIIRTRELDANDPEQAGYVCLSYEMMGDHDNAFEWFLKVETIKGADKSQIDSWRKTFVEAGWNGILRRRLELAEQKEKAGDNNYGEIASLAARLGENDKALDFLAKEMPLSKLFAAQVNVDPTFEKLRSDARFVEILKPWWQLKID